MMSGTIFSAALDMEDGDIEVCTPPAALLSSTARKILVWAVSAEALVCFALQSSCTCEQSEGGEVSIGTQLVTTHLT